MLGFIQKIFGGSKSEKDVRKITPIVEKVNQFFTSYASLTNDQLRNKTQEFRQRIQDHLRELNASMEERNRAAEELPFNDLVGKDAIYQEVDKLKQETGLDVRQFRDAVLVKIILLLYKVTKRN